MRILFLAPRLPAPPLVGYQVRAYHQLRLLGARHRITLVCFAPPPGSKRLERLAVERFCDEIVLVPWQPAAAASGVLRSALAGRPLQAGLFDTPAMRRTVARLLRERRHDVLHVQLARMAPHIPPRAAPPVVVDLVDALSLNMQRRAAFDRPPMRWIAALEAARLRRYEQEVCRRADRATVVSETDRRAIGPLPNLTVNANGVDLESFAFGAGARDPEQVVFSGNLGYFPNVDAVLWFAREVLPLVRREAPQVRLWVVGARPARAVRALPRLDPRIAVPGFVPDLRPYLAHSRVAVAPMRAGSGQLFKILEAMACGTAVVATSVAASGLAAEAGRHLLIADSAEDFARCVVRLLREPDLAARLGAEGRRLVEERHGWDRCVGELEAIYRSLVEG